MVMVFDTLLDPIFRPLLGLPPFIAILIIAFVITLAITLVYKYATDQNRMKHLKQKVKEYQEKMKKARNDPEKMMKLQKEAMKYNGELMKHSFKPTLYTLIPILIIFGWLNAHMAFYNLAPNEPFTITAERADGFSGGVALRAEPPLTIERNGTDLRWTASGDAGSYKLIFEPDSGEPVEKRVLITEERRYENPEERYKDALIRQVTIGNSPVKPLGGLSLFGWHPGWLGTYILLSVALSIGLRKLLRVV